MRQPADSERQARLSAELRRERKLREEGYRQQALRMFPHVCGRCGREFSGRRLRELTVHHRDHDHTNNPPDGSNWELLCLYCHDHEHEKEKVAGHFAEATAENLEPSASIFQPFAGLDAIVKLAAGKADNASVAQRPGGQAAGAGHSAEAQNGDGSASSPS